jgi:hypothetical protein
LGIRHDAEAYGPEQNFTSTDAHRRRGVIG